MDWYRYEDRRYANPVDEWGEPTGSHTAITLRKLPLLKVTRCGAWVEELPGYRRFCRNDATIPWASPTQEGALAAFLRRKAWQRKQREIELDRLDRIIAKARSADPTGIV